MNETYTAVDWLRTEYSKRRMKNPQYSLRSFARQLKTSPGALSQILSRKRALTLKQGIHLSDSLSLIPTERRKFLKLIHTNDVSSTPSFEEIGFDTFQLIADWYHYAIVMLINTEDFQPDKPWIAKRLGISPVEVQGALERLERLGFIEKDKGSFRVIKKQFATKTDVSNSAVRMMHRQTMSHAINALEDTPLSERDITFMVLALDPEKLPQAKKIITQFRRRLSRFLEAGKQKEVYTLNIQLVPLTKRTEKVQV